MLHTSIIKKERSLILEKTKEHEVVCHIILAYGKILPAEIIEQPAYGSVNFHGSLLPILRGASPIESALRLGHRTTGFTLQKIVSELDAGAILATEQLAIEANDNRQSLFEKLSQSICSTGPGHVVAYLAGKYQPVEQDHKKATFVVNLSLLMAKLIGRPLQCKLFIKAGHLARGLSLFLF